MLDENLSDENILFHTSYLVAKTLVHDPSFKNMCHVAEIIPPEQSVLSPLGETDLHIGSSELEPILEFFGTSVETNTEIESQTESQIESQFDTLFESLFETMQGENGIKLNETTDFWTAAPFETVQTTVQTTDLNFSFEIEPTDFTNFFPMCTDNGLVSSFLE